MAWRTFKLEEQRKEFITELSENQRSVSELCHDFGISRKTAYKWISRFDNEGLDGLKDRSKARHTQAQKTNNDVISKLLEVKRLYSKWGPKKILAFLEKSAPLIEWPSTTTIGNILENNGLTIPRKYRKRFPAKTAPLSHCLQPNDVWAIDFKGWFKTKDHIKCDPLTLTDSHSRFLLHCSKLSLNTVEYVWKALTEAFCKYGLPSYLRHDNGPPFATCGSGRLSRLSVNLIKAGVIPEWIEPGKPYQNGRHERMHLTLKEEGAFPLKLTLKEQQLKFREFQHYFNFERPHEALGQKTPGSLYAPSNRIWTGALHSPEYSQEFKVVRVRVGGLIAWHGIDVFIGKTLESEYVGLKENEDGDWVVSYGPVHLGTINHEQRLVHPMRKTRRTTKYKEKVY